MRKYGKLLLMLAVLAAVPAVASADGLPGGRQQLTTAGNPAQKTFNQHQVEQVHAALQKAQIDGYGISIEVTGGVVKLNGKVRQPGHAARAAEVCQQLPGITRVINELEYVRTRPGLNTLLSRLTGRQRQQAPEQPVQVAQRQKQAPPVRRAIQQVKAEVTRRPSNQQMAEQIGSSLSQAGLAGQNIGIQYQQGVVTLNGGVDSVARRSAAEQAARRVPGVESVNNQLNVTQPQTQSAYPPQYSQPARTVSHEQQLASAGHLQSSPIPTTMEMTQVSAGPAAIGGAGVFSHPQLPSHAWPAYAQYPNSAAVTYPTQYSASAFPYIGPFYPYPQVPLGWRDARLQWDDGFWNLNFNKPKSVWEILYDPSGK
ncbi:MAG: BON domain-containing protein [Fuerstiella sp.]|nr:BON domain-containing protein [Fuerstiella sp.]